MNFRHWTYIIVSLVSVLIRLPAIADCPKYNTLPRAREGAIGYESTDKCLFVCNGTEWQSQCATSTPSGCTGICVPGSDPVPFNLCVEAEDPDNNNSTNRNIYNHANASDGKYLSSFGNPGEYLDFKPITVPEADYYNLDIFYASAENPSAYIVMNGGTNNLLHLGTSHIEGNFVSWTTFNKRTIKVPFQSGVNNIRVSGVVGGLPNGSFGLDKICIRNDAPVDYCASGTTWQTSTWSTCSASCGGGTQTRSVSCLGSDGATVCPNSKCTGGMPAAGQSCNTHSCCTPSNRTFYTSYSCAAPPNDGVIYWQGPVTATVPCSGPCSHQGQACMLYHVGTSAPSGGWSRSCDYSSANDGWSKWGVLDYSCNCAGW